MTMLQAVMLGIIQGLTEFLPVSSTAHLAAVPWLLNWSIDPEIGFAFDVLVQLGTLTAVVVYFWRDLAILVAAAIRSLCRRSLDEPAARQAWLLVLATIPAVIGGLLLRRFISNSLQSPLTIGCFLAATGIFLWLAGRMTPRKDATGMTWSDAVWIGLGQTIALFPGASRSGWTTGTGILRGLDRISATRFAFLMAIPVMAGAGVVEIVDVTGNPALSSNLPLILAGFLTAAVVGFAAIAGLLRFLRSRSLNLFAVYCLAAGLFLTAVAVIRG
jgi:undecaprenyl-diphosphatase